MFCLKDSVRVHAPVERCFLLSTSLELVARTIGLKAVEGKTSGLVVGADQLVWRGWKFGIPAMHETLITAYERPRFFQDTMGRGRFKAFQHDHHFERVDGETVMADEVRFSLPMGFAGQAVGMVIVVPHVRKLMRERFAMLKRIAEGDDWERYLVGANFEQVEGISSMVR